MEREILTSNASKHAQSTVILCPNRIEAPQHEGKVIRAVQKRTCPPYQGKPLEHHPVMLVTFWGV